MIQLFSNSKKTFILLFSLLAILLAAPACKTKTGCPTNGDMAPKLNRKGEIKKKKGSTQLYSKRMRKKMKKH